MTMTESPRIDYWDMRWDASTATVDDETGFMRVSGVASQVGVLEYGKIDGAPRDGYFEFVPPEVVADEASIASLRGLPMTNEHPDEMLDTSNTGKHQVGSISDVRIDGSGDETKLRIDALFTDKGAIAAYQDGKVQLSPGYYSKIDETPGEFKGKKFDARQGPRRYNHLAIVPQARAGPSNRLDSRRNAWGRTFRTDGLRIQQSRGEEMKNKYKDKKDREGAGDELSDEAVTINVDGEEIVVDQRVKDLHDNLLEKLKQLEKSDQEEEEKPEEEASEGEETEDAGDDPEKDKDGKTDMVTQEQFKEAKDAIAALPKQILSAISKRDEQVAAEATARSEIVHAASTVLPNSFKFDGKTNIEIQQAAIKAHDETWVPLAKADAAVPGLFAAATAGKVKKDTALEGIRDDDRTPEEGMIAKARKNMDSRLRLISDCPTPGLASTAAGEKGAA